MGDRRGSRGNLMRTAILRVLAGIAALALPASVFAAEPVPDVKGDGVGLSYTIIASSGGHWPASAGTFDKPGLYQRDLVIRITNQVDRRFWGVTILPGSDPKSAEPFIGELTGKDNHFAVFVDTDGYSVERSAATHSPSATPKPAAGRAARLRPSSAARTSITSAEAVHEPGNRTEL